MPISPGPINLAKTPIHIPSTNESFMPLDWFKFDGPSFGKYVTEICTAEEPGRLVMIETTPTDWPTWERHMDGDELVIVLEGSGTFYQDIDGEKHAMPFSAGDTFLNPKAVWHTADVTSPMRAVYVTPCPGTENKPR